MTKLETDRLILLPVNAGHETELHDLHCDPLIVSAIWNGRCPSLEETKAKLDLYLNDWETAGIGFWMVYRRLAGDAGLKLVGRTGFRRFAGSDDVELGYCYTKEASGQGIAGEAGRAVLSFAFNDVGLRKTVAVVAMHNLRAIRAAEKLGLRFVELRWHQGRRLRYYELQAEDFLREQRAVEGAGGRPPIMAEDLRRASGSA